MAVHIGLITASAAVERKLHEKHGGLNLATVRDAIQWPARSQAAWEDHPEHGRRLVAVGTDSDQRALICVLSPVPAWDERADTWALRTARWL